MRDELAGPAGQVAFVLGGGGVLGATQVGMLRALVEAEIRPDLILGTSVGAVNGAVIAADPSAAGVAVLTDLWQSMSESGIFSDNVLARATNRHQEPPVPERVHWSAPSRLSPFGRRESLPCMPASFAAFLVGVQ